MVNICSEIPPTFCIDTHKSLLLKMQECNANTTWTDKKTK